MGKNMFRRTFHIFCRPSGDQQGMNWRTKLSFIDGWSLANAGSCGNTFLLLLCKLFYKGRLSDKPCLAMCVSSLFCLLAVFNPTGDKNHFKVVCFFNVSPFFTHLLSGWSLEDYCFLALMQDACGHDWFEKLSVNDEFTSVLIIVPGMPRWCWYRTQDTVLCRSADSIMAL